MRNETASYLCQKNLPDSQHCTKRLTEFSAGTEVYYHTVFPTISWSQVLQPTLIQNLRKAPARFTI